MNIPRAGNDRAVALLLHPSLVFQHDPSKTQFEPQPFWAAQWNKLDVQECPGHFSKLEGTHGTSTEDNPPLLLLRCSAASTRNFWLTTTGRSSSLW